VPPELRAEYERRDAKDRRDTGLLTIVGAAFVAILSLVLVLGGVEGEGLPEAVIGLVIGAAAVAVAIWGARLARSR
jgi:hypothetical protein